MKSTVWLRFEESEPVTLLSPKSCKILFDMGINICVERSEDRAFKDQDYEEAGCVLKDAGAWEQAGRDTIILGLKEVSESDFPLVHKHIFFMGVRKEDVYSDNIVQRFSWGKGIFFDLTIVFNRSLSDFAKSDGGPPPPPFPTELSSLISDSLLSPLMKLIESPTYIAPWDKAYETATGVIKRFAVEQNKRWKDLTVEKRAKVRIDLSRDITVETQDGEMVVCQSCDLSMSGMFLKTDVLFKLQSICKLHFSLTDESKDEVIIVGKITRSEDGGLGVYFVDMEIDDFNILKNHIKATLDDSLK